MGRHKMPSKLAKNCSRKHFTKAELEEREREELDIATDAILPNDDLPLELHKRFFELVKEHEPHGIFTNLDSDALSRYVFAEWNYWKASKALAGMNIMDNYAFRETLKIQKEFFNQTNALAKELGMTMVSRSKLKREKEKEQETTPDIEMFGDML